MPIDFLDIPFSSVLAVSRCRPRWTVDTRLSWESRVSIASADRNHRLFPIDLIEAVANIESNFQTRSLTDPWLKIDRQRIRQADEIV
ncbi:hypothetical protein, partial [Pseudomonas aeruginosa]|uniref:hypothetical protein n=1 Tax=Pseudomonas aeruginosa TaxID=287 RepID=UPI003967FEA4